MKLHDDVHNYYEKLVLEEIDHQQLQHMYDSDTLADLCCTVLNQLPPRYIRFDVDMAFYLSTAEAEQMQEKVEAAVKVALSLIAKRGSHAQTREQSR
ncbi:late competence development ComFB family protein [Pseudoalteromonas sp. MM17-2]|uniref:late competence development ComFB family protein n=1 Tax=Pseudoalteromonas sp. MM17-2 TaxID=2917753 RepID=UPI001EF6172C|nr:late competence development ComFB family protein [Pseudoalteromonas sp. MM17-2]MCG7545143.1 late competence development ComFB family protein [Pseudoalteromonas sp. MM17-2]